MNSTARTLPRGDPPARRDLVLFGLCLGALVWVLSLVFAEQSGALQRDPAAVGIGYVRSAVKQVRRRGQGRLVWQHARADETVRDHDALYVGDDSTAEVCFDNGSCIDIDENSLVVVAPVEKTARKPAAAPAITAHVRRGGVAGSAGGGSVTISAAGAVTSLTSGSRARVVVGPARTTKIDVTRGSATVTTKAGGSLDVRQGQRGTVRADGSAEPVSDLRVELLSPQSGARVPYVVGGADVTFRWRPPPGLESCVLELSNDPSFTAPPLQVESRKSEHTHEGMTAGVYYWRVHCPHEGGRELSAERRLTLVQERPPVPLRPAAGSVVVISDGAELALSWGEVPDAGGYLVEIAVRDDPGGRPHATLRADRPAALVSAPLPEGDYCFKVRAEHAQHDAEVDGKPRQPPPWSERRCFRLVTRPVLEAPRVYEPAPGGASDDGG